MPLSDVTLEDPANSLRSSWLASWDEWGRDAHQPGSGLALAARYGLDLRRRSDFDRWVNLLASQRDSQTVMPDGMVPVTYQWIVRDGQYCGGVALRHVLTPLLAELGGHIGYAVRPSARGHGLAEFALTAMLPLARELGLEQVMVTCDDSNAGSRRTIEKAGGVLQDIRPPDSYSTAHGFFQPLRRYWITCVRS